MGRILITGASGNVGRYVAQYSLENGQEITAAGTHTDTLAEMFGDRAEIVYFDFTDPKPSLAKKYWIEVRGLEKEYCTVMSILYLMTRLGTAEKVTSVFEEIMGKKPRSFQEFVRKNAASWK